MARIAFRIEFLDRWPRDERANEQLRGLLRDYHVTGQPHAMTAAIDRFRPHLKLPEWQLDWAWLMNAEDAQKERIARRLLRTSAPPAIRANTMYALAGTLHDLDRSDEAVRMLDRLLSEFDARHEVSRICDLARSRRERILAGR